VTILTLIVFAVLSPFAALYISEREIKIKPKQVCVSIFFIAIYAVLYIRNSEFGIALINDCIIVACGGAAALTDLSTRRVPNKLVLAMAGIWLTLALMQTGISFEAGMQGLINGTLGFLLGGGMMLIVYILSRKGLGAGDVKFMAVAGLYVSYGQVLMVMFIGGVLCLLTALVLMVMKKLKLKDSLPLVPFLYVGIAVVLLI
jgi:Flp pilus assembly protein protease CpaA